MTTTQTQPRLSPKKRRIFRLVAVTLSLLVCFMCSEIALRIFGPKYHRFTTTTTIRHEYLDIEGDTTLERLIGSDIYYSNPRHYFDAWRDEDGTEYYGIDIQAVGPPMRRVPEHIQKPDDIRTFLDRDDTILALGDSFTMGLGVRYEDTFVRRLERLLAKEGTPPGIKNTAFAGYDLEEICSIYDTFSAQRRYRLVIYGFVLNDFGMPRMAEVVGSDYINIDSGGNCYDPWRRHCASLNFVYHLIERRRLDRTTKRSYVEAFQGSNAADKFELLRSLSRKIDTDGGQLVIVLFPLLHEFQDYPFREIHDTLGDFCREEDIFMVNLLPAFSNRKAESLWVHPTDYHPNEIAHGIAAQKIHAFLQDHGLLQALTAGEH